MFKIRLRYVQPQHNNGFVYEEKEKTICHKKRTFEVSKGVDRCISLSLMVRGSQICFHFFKRRNIYAPGKTLSYAQPILCDGHNTTLLMGTRQGMWSPHGPCGHHCRHVEGTTLSLWSPHSLCKSLLKKRKKKSKHTIVMLTVRLVKIV